MEDEPEEHSDQEVDPKDDEMDSDDGEVGIGEPNKR